jgi:hypothetical protein
MEQEDGITVPNIAQPGASATVQAQAPNNATHHSNTNSTCAMLNGFNA